MRARWAKVGAGRVWTATRDCCRCAGYWFPHRRGGGACLAGARSDYHRAVRDGEPKLQALQHLSVDQLEWHWPLES